jgi:uridine kinase
MLDVDALRGELTKRKARLVAIDGRGGSGKSTLARQLADGWDNAVVIEMDDFYRPVPERVQRPQVHGENFDRVRLSAEVLEPLAANAPGRYQRYDWDEDRLAEWHDVPTDSIVLVEGVYSTSALLRDHFDYKIWVDAPAEVRLRRGLERDGEAMRSKWVEEWMPAEDRYVQEERPDLNANLLLDGSGGSEIAPLFDVVEDRGS